MVVIRCVISRALDRKDERTVSYVGVGNDGEDMDVECGV